MNLELILVLAVFVVLPLLQAIVERGRQASPPDQGAGEGGAEAGAAPRRPEPRAGSMRPPPVMEWERLVRTMPPPHVEAAPGTDATLPWMRPRPEDPPAPRMVSLEELGARPAPVDADPARESEHARFHRRLAASAPPARPAAKNRLRLGGPGEIRRAIVLSEVFGPPRALRPLGDDDR